MTVSVTTADALVVNGGKMHSASARKTLPMLATVTTQYTAQEKNSDLVSSVDFAQTKVCCKAARPITPFAAL